MTAREQLREQVEGLSEEQARDVLGVLASRRLIALHQAAPSTTKPKTSPTSSSRPGRRPAAGKTVSLADARRELFGAWAARSICNWPGV